MTTKKKQGAAYGRKSREGAATLESQINACIEWAEKNDIELELFIEEGTQSSEEWDRPQLQAMLKKVERLEFDYVIVSEQTRISRNEDFSIFKRLMRETGTLFALADTNEEINYLNQNDAFKSGAIQLFGEYELATTKTRLKRGTVQSAKKGNWVAKKAPIGYQYDPVSKRLKKNKDAEVVRLMFDLYMNGMSTVEITHKFIHENINAYHKLKGEMVPVQWSKSTVSRSLNNIAYVGHTQYGKTTTKKIAGKKQVVAVDEEQQILIENTHEKIVSPEEWDKVQAIMKKKRNLPAGLKHAKHTFSGLILCKNCKSTHTFEMGSNGKKRISSCKSRIYNDDFTTYKMCGNSGGELENIEKLFDASLRETATQIENYIETIKEIQISGSKAKSKNTQKNIKMQQVEQMKKKRKKIQGYLLEEDFFTGEEEIEKVREVKQLQNRIKGLEKEIEEMEEKEGESELDQFEKVLENINKFFSLKADSTISEKILNEVLSEFIGTVFYERNGRWAPMKIKVLLKDDIQEIFSGNEELTKIA
jgi:DNA invertase Pin-like site-specific DNA recombinase